MGTSAFSVRRAPHDMELALPSGEIRLRSGDNIVVANSLYHFDDTIFGEDCHTFRFDRFANETKLPAVMPFGGGKSMCPGRYFAANEMRILVVELLRAYTWQ